MSSTTMDIDATTRMMEDQSQSHGVLLSPIMTTASTPATPGPSTPTTVRTLPLDDDLKDDEEEEIIPPERPQSTPFPRQDSVDRDIRSPFRQMDIDDVNRTLDLFHVDQIESLASPFCELPVEIHECILDHLFGVRASASTRNVTAGKTKSLRNWGTALRHSRRREVSELALVSIKWRELIQERLYRHLKIKGTRESIEQATEWFYNQPHLCSYVKHIEIWFPVFQQKSQPSERSSQLPAATPDRPALLRSLTNPQETGNNIAYESPSNNCTLEEAFQFIRQTFAEACVLTLEGGDRRKPPMVQQFYYESSTTLPVLDKIQTLVCKGQWNIMRANEDFQNIANALPNMIEWHGSYAKPKSKTYISMAATLPHLPITLTHLNLTLEGDFKREVICPVFFKKVSNKTHFCAEMAKAIPTLEYLQYTGRICHCLFDNAAKISNPRDSRLKSVDLIVKNVCRPSYLWNDGSGVMDMAFILSFEKLVLSAVKSLNKLTSLGLVRIRFIDLECQVPALNPYFHLENNKCTGIWSDAIIDTLAKSRPTAGFVEKTESLGDISFKDGQLQTAANFPKTRPLSIKVGYYASFSTGITIV